jgi:hypothetical protein
MTRMLNRRHKTALFITLIVTGCSLLAGATLAEGLGILILGLTFAWVFGSAAITRMLQSARKVPSRSWPILRVLIWMALAGCLLDAVALESNSNTFLVVSTMALFGMLASSFVRLNAEKEWLKYVAAILGTAIFLGTSLGLGDLLFGSSSSHDMTLFAQVIIYGLIAFPIGIFWLIKGWRLVLKGISFEGSDPAIQSEHVRQKGILWLHILLFAGVFVLTLCLGGLAFSAFSSSVFASDTKTGDASQTLFPTVLLLMLFAWWPYACWQSILEREPNTTPKYATRHKLVTTVLGSFFIVILSVAITFGIQNGSDRMTTATIENATKGFQAISNKIGSIKSRDMETTKDYIQAYEEIEFVLPDFDDKLQQFTQALTDSENRNKSRGPLNIQYLYGRKNEEWTKWDKTAFDLLRQDSELTKRQIQVVRSMADLPEGEQVAYWRQNFQPLQQQEESLRQQMAAVKQKIPQ